MLTRRGKAQKNDSKQECLFLYRTFIVVQSDDGLVHKLTHVAILNKRNVSKYNCLD